MSDEQRAFLNAIHADPADDLVRLVYADWLDEHGQPERAEFIRAQIEMTRLDEDSEECRAFRIRQYDLQDALRTQWATEVGVVESEKLELEYRRGFANGLRLSGCSASELAVAFCVPGLRRLMLWRTPITPDALQQLATLDLDYLEIRDIPFPRAWLELLLPLPIGTVLHVEPEEGELERDVWNEFQTRRIGRLSSLPPEARYAEARRWQRGRQECHDNSGTPGGESLKIGFPGACDAEMQLLAELQEIEDFSLFEGALTAVGLELIARLSKLRRLVLFRGRFESITPLARCTALEELTVYPAYQVVIGDAGTEGLEQLVNLRELKLRSPIGERTLARLGSLRKLTSLDIELEDGLSAESFAPLSHLTALEQLKIDGDVHGGALRFLAPCTKLQKLTLRVPTGNANDFAAFGRLTELRELHITGFAVADEALQYLAPLKKLHRLDAQKTLVLPAGARWLADQLPEVTVTLDKYVAKSPRPAVTFCRRLAERDDLVSAMLPTHWAFSEGTNTAEPTPAFFEDGWGSDFPGTYSAGPAVIWLYGRDEVDAAAIWDRFVGLDNPHYQPTVEERDVVELAGNGRSCVIEAGNVRSLVAIITSEGKCAVLDCDAPVSRFEEFRPLFLFVARSLRVGEAAKQGIGEEVTVAVSNL